MVSIDLNLCADSSKDKYEIVNNLANNKLVFTRCL